MTGNQTQGWKWGAILATILVLSGGGCGWKYTAIASGFGLIANVRPSLAGDGTVVAAESGRLLVSDGVAAAAIDIGAQGLAFQQEASGKSATQIQKTTAAATGDIVFVANHPGLAACSGPSARGAYRVSAAGGALTTLFEGCVDFGVGAVGRDIALSPNGTVAFSQITNGKGALYRGPAAGPVAILHTGSGMLFNTTSLDVNDAGRVVVDMEYSDQVLRRGLLVFDTPEQPLATVETAIEKLTVGVQPTAAINTAGSVAFSLPIDVTITINSIATTFVAGVYTATPTLLNTPKSLTLIADLSGPYCGFGAVAINDYGLVAFEARLDSAGGCASASFDGIFTGADPQSQAVVVRGNSALGGHQFFDNIVLGEINSANQISFTTTESEPLVDPVKVWRAQM